MRRAYCFGLLAGLSLLAAGDMVAKANPNGGQIDKDHSGYLVTDPSLARIPGWVPGHAQAAPSGYDRRTGPFSWNPHRSRGKATPIPIPGPVSSRKGTRALYSSTAHRNPWPSSSPSPQPLPGPGRVGTLNVKPRPYATPIPIPKPRTQSGLRAAQPRSPSRFSRIR